MEITLTGLAWVFAGIVVLFVLLSMGSAVFQWLRHKTKVGEVLAVSVFARYAVLAAEQAAMAGLVTNRKSTAIGIVKESLRSADIENISDRQIEGAIEAAVKEELNQYRSFLAPVKESPDDQD